MTIINTAEKIRNKKRKLDAIIEIAEQIERQRKWYVEDITDDSGNIIEQHISEGYEEYYDMCTKVLQYLEAQASKL